MVATAVSIGGVLIAPAPAFAAKSYSNCAALNGDYPHGVGKAGATDSTSGTPVTDFTVDNDLYSANTARDRDDDGIACEKH
ncbi:excalibur calcium-binding domain-containing protein [Gordonia sp. CPCC 205333]|uniref:excalibur calcium-binding domain-containing protein n=1 Tax=Gordonia sp. CPCC 205333 TaxID=3140790 RepID=UPI003AF3C68B